ncbi:GNAT family N-acetyltransferase [Wenjunlia tyrosinilytica]|jgi:ribosomal protein S18 acetylase RimI-like enzyme|uniref:N-acetyltransferase n=1 Tax=Wenjunlia tyrosinilytica TaxID=1544741 RepID=A0A917ZLB4_9ACTN|nr:GNAT family N-acetyltransferase [Wenjunlia tyrosinilytica]GGO85950.1 N-acetyltransferase [Wenjunlia tyrosinilytica]
MVGDFALGGQLKVRITPSDVGKRVSVRRVTEIVGGRPVFGDVVGVLTSWDAGVLMITRRTGEVVRVSEDSLVAGKTVPRAPARRRAGSSASPAELQRIAARGWPALENEPLGGWTLRAASGFTRRANSVLPLGDPGLPLDEALDRVADWYARRSLPAYVQVTTGAEGSDEELAAALEERGWTGEASTLMRTAPLVPLTAIADDTRAVRLSREVDEAWLSRYHRTGRLGPEAAKVLGAGPSVWLATVPGEEPGRAPAAIGRCVVDGRWAGFAAIEVAPEHRRRGLGTAVMAALAARAAEEGADLAYLQVMEDNESARVMYDAMGFTTHHAYHYRRAPRP